MKTEIYYRLIATSVVPTKSSTDVNWKIQVERQYQKANLSFKRINAVNHGSIVFNEEIMILKKERNSVVLNKKGILHLISFTRN